MRKLLFSLILSVLSSFMAWADVTFKATAPSAVAVGQQFRVEYTANARANGINVDMEGHGFEVLYGPSNSTSSSTSIVNGQVTSEVKTIFSYVLLAEKEGTFTLPAASCKADGQTLTSNALTVKVLPADTEPAASQSSGGGSQQASNAQAGTAKFNKNDYHLVLDLSKTSVYEGEALVATLKLYWRNTQMGNPTDVKLPDFEGFTVQDMDNSTAQATLEHYQGANYQMYPLAKWLLFPSRSGEITIPASSLKANVQIVTTRRSGGFFDWPMEYTQNVEVPLQSAPRKVSVKALPGKPANYMNAVGDYKVSAELTANKVKTNDAVIYRLTIEGTGNLKYTREPEPEFPSDFEVFDPKVDLDARATAAGLQGKKVIEYTIIPRHAGTFNIPAIEFGYFDIKSGQFKTLTTQSFQLEVEKGADDGSQGNVAVDFTGANQERIKVLGNDIRYLHQVDADDLDKDEEPFYGSLMYWLLYIIPFIAALIAAIAGRRQIKLNADIAGKRTRKAGKLAEKRLRAANTALKANDEGNFYEAIHKAMLGYVGDKLRIQLSDLNIDNIQQTLSEHRVSDATIATVKDVLETCQFARYAPSHDTHAMDELYKKASATLEALESEIKA